MGLNNNDELAKNSFLIFPEGFSNRTDAKCILYFQE